MRTPLRLLSSDEVYEMYLGALEILEQVGVEVHEDSVLKGLEEGGADVDHRSKLVKFPQHLVEESVRSAPRRVTLCGRTSEYDMKLEDRRVFFAAGANALYVLDPKDGQVRNATTDDCVNFAKLADALENIHCYLSLVSPLDVPPEGVDRLRCAIAFKNSSKHFFHDAQGEEGAEDQVQMAAAVMGGIEELRKRPLLSLAPCVTSPLSWGQEALEVLRVMAKYGLPQIVSSEPMAGGTSPVSLAGSLVQQMAEVLSGVVMTQVLNKGTPVLVCTLPSIMDMRTGNVALGSTELGLLSAGMAQIMQAQRLPYVGSGGIADAKTMDEQAAYEKAISCLLPALAGTNLIHLSSGMLEAILTISYEQVVIDNEILGMVKRAVQGIEVTDITLAVDLIKEVGPGKHFLNKPHTRDLLRQEHFIPSLTDRSTRKDWERRGSKDIVTRARELVDELLKSHQPDPLDPSIQEQLDSTVKKAKRGMAEKG